MKFNDDDEGKSFFFFFMIPKNKIKEYKPDYVIVATLKYIGIIEDFEINHFDKTKIKVLPLARIPLLDLIKEIWNN